jgi:hypothetical protein
MSRRLNHLTIIRNTVPLLFLMPKVQLPPPPPNDDTSIRSWNQIIIQPRSVSQLQVFESKGEGLSAGVAIRLQVPRTGTILSVNWGVMPAVYALVTKTTFLALMEPRGVATVQLLSESETPCFQFLVLLNHIRTIFIRRKFSRFFDSCHS